MRLRTLTFLLPAILLAGCGDFMDFDLDITIPVSLHPLATKDDTTFDERLLGRWQDPPTVVTFDRADANSYRIKYTEDGDRFASFRANLMDLDGSLMLDVMPDSPDPNTADRSFILYLRTHMFFRIDMVEPVLKIQLANFRSILDEDPNCLPHETVEYEGLTYLVITASTPELRRFLKRHVSDEEFFGSICELRRAESAPHKDPNTILSLNEPPATTRPPTAP